MHIAAFESDPHTIAELVDLILFCQDGEAKLNITMPNSPTSLPFRRTIRCRVGGSGWQKTRQAMSPAALVC